MNNMKEYTAENIPIRIQFTLYNRLEAECIVQGFREAERVTNAFHNLKYKRNKPMGGACSQHADIPKVWNTKVGATINDADCIWNRK